GRADAQQDRAARVLLLLVVPHAAARRQVPAVGAERHAGDAAGLGFPVEDGPARLRVPDPELTVDVTGSAAVPVAGGTGQVLAVGADGDTFDLRLVTEEGEGFLARLRVPHSQCPVPAPREN